MAAAKANTSFHCELDIVDTPRFFKEIVEIA